MIKSGAIPSKTDNDCVKVRQEILSNLLKSVQICQTKFGGRPELATEIDNQVHDLCKCWEQVFSNGLRSRPQLKNSSALEQVTGIVANTFKISQDTLCFWHFVRNGLTKHEMERYMSLKNIWTDIGRGRAWLRSSLNERSLERYLQILLANRDDILIFYHKSALLLDDELNSTLSNMAAGLGSILFAITIDEQKLNQHVTMADGHHLSRSEPILAVPAEDNPHRTRRKKAPAHIISFDSADSTPEPSASILSTSAESASVLVTNTEDDTPISCQRDVEKPAMPVSGNSPSPSSNDSSMHDFDSTSQKREPLETVATLTPVNDREVGELMLISTDELPGDEISIGESEDLSVDTVISRKGAAEISSIELEQLYTALDHLQEINAGLRTKLKSCLTRHRAEAASTNSKLITLTRENEVLKHQLRKYVSAVQMLNRDGAAHEALAYLEASKMAATQREEATKYQEQLVEVAQMHGELMEFNERLQRILLGKEEIIRRLERELTDLRGPLPLSTGWDDDQSASGPDALINIWIPSAFLTGGSSSVHHLYQVYVRIRDTEWNIYRRYAQFYVLHKQLKKAFPVIATLDFPPKKTIGNKDSKFVEDRRQRLQRYLRQAVDAVSRARPEMSDPNKFVSIIPFFSQNSSPEEERAKTKNSVKKRGRNDYPPTCQYNGL